VPTHSPSRTLPRRTRPELPGEPLPPLHEEAIPGPLPVWRRARELSERRRDRPRRICHLLVAGRKALCGGPGNGLPIEVPPDPAASPCPVCHRERCPACAAQYRRDQGA
jgi:hypothetical protein